MIIVIDGLSGSGKSSTAKAVAEKLNIQYLDSGALYRAVTFIWLKENGSLEEFIEILLSKDIRFEYRENMFRVFVDGWDVTESIRTQKVSETVSKIAARPEIRGFVNDLMHNAVKKNDYIADGRDLGTAVFPNADLKFFMNADLDVRAERRFAELQAGSQQVSFEKVKTNLRERDQLDTNREADPLKMADDAIRIDTSKMTFEQQVEYVSSVIRDKLNIN